MKRRSYNSWDRTHSFSALGNYIFNNKWDMNWKLSLQSGQAYTPIIGYYNQILPEGPMRFIEQYQALEIQLDISYSRLDLGIVYHTKLFGSKRYLCSGYKCSKQENIFENHIM